jgi:hypothetical protein
VQTDETESAIQSNQRAPETGGERIGGLPRRIMNEKRQLKRPVESEIKSVESKAGFEFEKTKPQISL